MTDFAKLVLDADTRGLKSAEGDLRGVAKSSAETAQKVGASPVPTVEALARNIRAGRFATSGPRDHLSVVDGGKEE